jgi:ACR3 family arsenite efflux pump ArsB
MNSISEVWKALSIWRKAILGLMLIMWVAFTGEIIVSANGDILGLIVGLCLLWLAYVAVAFVVSTLGQSDYS